MRGLAKFNASGKDTARPRLGVVNRDACPIKTYTQKRVFLRESVYINRLGCGHNPRWQNKNINALSDSASAGCGIAWRSAG